MRLGITFQPDKDINFPAISSAVRRWMTEYCSGVLLQTGIAPDKVHPDGDTPINVRESGAPPCACFTPGDNTLVYRQVEAHAGRCSESAYLSEDLLFRATGWKITLAHDDLLSAVQALHRALDRLGISFEVKVLSA